MPRLDIDLPPLIHKVFVIDFINEVVLMDDDHDLVLKMIAVNDLPLTVDDPPERWQYRLFVDGVWYMSGAELHLIQLRMDNKQAHVVFVGDPNPVGRFADSTRSLLPGLLI